MSAPVLVATVAAVVAVLLALPPGPVRPGAVGRTRPGEGSGPPGAAPTDRVQRLAPLWAACACVGTASFVSGRGGWVAGLVVGALLWVLVRRSEPASVRRRRERVRRDLPAFVELYAAALASGASPGTALTVVCDALPGAAADDLAPVAARLALGLDPDEVWRRLVAESPQLAPLGRVMVRSHEAGVAVTTAVLDLADELAASGRAAVEDRARTVGVRAAVPLGVCLLPAFLLLGIVPLVAAAVDGIRW